MIAPPKRAFYALAATMATLCESSAAFAHSSRESCKVAHDINAYRFTARAKATQRYRNDSSP